VISRLDPMLGGRQVAEQRLAFFVGLVGGFAGPSAARDPATVRIGVGVDVVVVDDRARADERFFRSTGRFAGARGGEALVVRGRSGEHRTGAPERADADVLRLQGWRTLRNVQREVVCRTPALAPSPATTGLPNFNVWVKSFQAPP